MQRGRRKGCPCAKPYVSYTKIWMEFLSNVMLAAVVLFCALAPGDCDLCNLDTGYTSITFGRGQSHGVHISYKRDGGLWARIGVEGKSQDWIYNREKRYRLQTTLIDQDSLSFLEAIHYKDFCVISDLVIRVWAEGGWHPSFLNVFDPKEKVSRIVSFKNHKNCYMQTNFSLSPKKQGLFCDGGITNTCGVRNLPEKRRFSKTSFLQVVKLDPEGPDYWRCDDEVEIRNMYTFLGSYYHVYVKLDDCARPWESRDFGHEAMLRALQDENENTVIIPDPTQRALSEGLIRGWQVFNKIVSIEHEVYLQVWRRYPQQHTDMYKLVGQTLYKPTELRFHEVVLSPDMYIRVQEGDVLGLYYPKFNPIAYSSVPCAYPMQRYRYIEAPDGVLVGFAKMFVSADDGPRACRQYSFTAVFANKSHAKKVDDWVCPTSDPPQVLFAGEQSKDTDRDDYSNGDDNNVDTNWGSNPNLASTVYTGLVPLHLILIIAACLILMLIIIGFISYYRAVKS